MSWPGVSKSELAAVTVLACGAIAGVLAWAVRDRAYAPTSAITFTTEETPADKPAEPEEALLIAVHVAGAVERPGLYEIPIGSRVQDAIQLAGGAKPGAYLDGVNLAAIVRDGEQVFVPSEPTGPSGGSTTDSTPTASRGAKPLPQSKININTATKAELMRLPGVGEVTADKIIAKRRELGRFAYPEQLMEVRGIGEKKFDDMKEYVTVN